MPARDLYLWPAINEAYGMAFLEAQAAGLPVVAGRTGGVPAVVADGVTGLLTPIGDAAAFAGAVARLLDGRPNAHAWRRAARRGSPRIMTSAPRAHALAAALAAAAMSGVPFAILRHAPTAWNAERPPAGPHRHLAQRRGRGRGATLASAAAGRPLARMCSPLQRARRTAELLQPSAPVTIDSRLREMSFGIWEGQTVAELRARAARPSPRPNGTGSTSSRRAGSRRASPWRA